MQRKPSLCAVLLLVSLLVFQGLAPDLQAQGPPPPTPQELDQLLAPIALYPDSLLAQITTASTNPQEILDFDNWLGQNQNLSVSQLTAAALERQFERQLYQARIVHGGLDKAKSRLAHIVHRRTKL
jgi:Protein of unknown function (DUF3300)